MAKQLEIENAKIKYRNFSGAPTKFNPKGGVRTFCLVIEDTELADQLSADGWNVRMSAAREEGDEPTYYVEVKVSFDNIPPNIYMVTSKKKTKLTEDTVGSLDYADIKSIDLVINPSRWEMHGKEGIKAYLKTMYVIINEDPFAHKYTDDEYDDMMPWN